ncbi:MAG TPA: hypothetical protein VHU83_21440 [Bryobacteraceae bacterium]|jgi:hypothetical protein|nr:hypothetical protein [Bryobacteraceae bacterium]
MASTTYSQDYQERQIEIDGWPVRLTSYRVGDRYICQADNVSPGACLARTSASSAREAESHVVSKARHLLGKTKRREV